MKKFTPPEHPENLGQEEYNRRIRQFITDTVPGRIFEAHRRGVRPALSDLARYAITSLLIDLPLFFVRFFPNPFGAVFRGIWAKSSFGYFGKNSILDYGVIVEEPGNVFVSDFTWIDRYTEINARCGYVYIGKRVHVSPNCTLSGLGGIVIGDYAGISRNVHIFSHSEAPRNGGVMSGPMVPEEFKGMVTKPVHIKKHAFVGTGSIILPGVTLHEGAVVGANSVVKRDVPAWEIHSGNPAVKIGTRAPVKEFVL